MTFPVPKCFAPRISYRISNKYSNREPHTYANRCVHFSVF